MYFIGDKIKLNWKREDYPMIHGDKDWDAYITRQIVAIPSPGKFLVKMSWCEREDIISIEDIKLKMGE